jgi:serine/threonine-protein kinase
MLTGIRPFDGDTLTAIMYQIVHGQPKSMLETNKTLKPPVADIVAKVLSKEPSDRYNTCSEFAHALLTGTAPAPAVAVAASAPLMATQVVGGGAAAAVAPARRPAVTPSPAPAPVAAAAKSSGSRVFLYLTVSLVLVAIAAVAWVKLTVSPAEPQQPAPVVQTEPQFPARPAARKPEGRKPARRSTTKTASATQSTESAAPAKKDVAADVELIDDTKPSAPQVPRVFDKAK